MTPDFEEWVRPHWRVMRLAAERIAGASDRDDALQEALVNAWKNWGRFDAARGSAKAWLVTITMNAARTIVRRRAQSAEHTDALDCIALESPSADERVDVDRAVISLPRRQRTAVTLYYFVGLTVEETAEVMQCAPGTVKATLSAARSALRGRLEGGSS